MSILDLSNMDLRKRGGGLDIEDVESSNYLDPAEECLNKSYVVFFESGKGYQALLEEEYGCTYGCEGHGIVSPGVFASSADEAVELYLQSCEEEWRSMQYC